MDVNPPDKAVLGYKPPTWVLVVACIEATMPFVTGYAALFFKIGLISCGDDLMPGSWQDLCIPTLGVTLDAPDEMIRGWGARQAVLAVTFVAAYMWQDRNVYKVAFLTFWFRAVHDLLAIALDGFMPTALLSFAAISCNTALVTLTMKKIW